MRNAFPVNETLVVGRDQPRSDDFRELADEGVRAVLDLRIEGENEQPLPPRDEETAVRRCGLEYGHVPVPAGRMDDALIDSFRSEFARLPKPVFVHCASGKRSGTLAFVQAAIEAGLSSAQTLERAEKAGAAYGSEQIRETVKRYVDRQAEKGARVSRRVRSETEPLKEKTMTKPTPHRVLALALGGCLMLGASAALAQPAASTSPPPMQSGSQPPSGSGAQPGGMAMQQSAMEECPMMKHSAQMAANMEKMQQQMAQMTAMMQKMQEHMGRAGKP